MLAVLFVLSIAAAQCQCIVQENALCQGAALFQVSDNVFAPDECCAMCSVTVGCKGWTLSQDGRCALKRSCTFMPTTNTTMNSRSGVLRTASPLGMCKAHFNMECYGQDIRDAGVVSSEQECCELCTLTLGCNTWTWKRGDDRHCWVKTGCSRGMPDDRFVSGTVPGAPPMPKYGKNAEPVYDSIDLAATFLETKKIFARMGLSVQDMTALIGAGHGSSKASLTGGEFNGQWVPPPFPIGDQYFKFLTNHGRGWCAVNAGGSALFVAGGPRMSLPAKDYSPIGYAENCVESAENKSMYGSPDARLPEVDPSKLIEVPGAFSGPAGAAAMLPTDFMLQYSPETYEYVTNWASNGGFPEAFQEAWQKVTENGVQRLCPEISSTASTVPDVCANDSDTKANYFELWEGIKNEVRHNLTHIPESCQSVPSTYCLASVFRVGWHISGTFDPNPVNGSANYAFGLQGGSEGQCFLGLCAGYDGCGGCLSKTIQAIKELGESIQSKYRQVIISLPDMLILASTVSAELLTRSRIPQGYSKGWTIPFRPGRQFYNISDLGLSKVGTTKVCMDIANRLPGPAYMGRSKSSYATTEAETGSMLSTDLII